MKLNSNGLFELVTSFAMRELLGNYSLKELDGIQMIVILLFLIVDQLGILIIENESRLRIVMETISRFLFGENFTENIPKVDLGTVEPILSTIKNE